MKFSIKDSLNKCDQIPEKTLVGKFIFCVECLEVTIASIF